MAYYTRKVKFTKTGQFGCGPRNEDDVYTVQQFREFCDNNSFTDYDGFGYPVKDRLADQSIIIKPSRIDEIPPDATHIIWFNR